MTDFLSFFLLFVHTQFFEEILGSKLFCSLLFGFLFLDSFLIKSFLEALVIQSLSYAVTQIALLPLLFQDAFSTQVLRLLVDVREWRLLLNGAILRIKLEPIRWVCLAGVRLLPCQPLSRQKRRRFLLLLLRFRQVVVHEGD